MKIVHCPTEIAGQMGTLCNELRKKGYETAGFNWFHSYINYHHKHVVNTDLFELKNVISDIVATADILHFHNGNTFLTGNYDLPSLAETGKKLIMQHWGSDVRTAGNVKKYNPYPLPAGYYSDEKIHEHLAFNSKYIKTAIVQDGEMVNHVADFYEKVYIMPLACNLDKFSPRYPGENKVPVIIHAPTNKEFKGSEYVEAAIDKMKGKVPFEYQMVEKKSHKEALAMYSQSDIIVDQIMCGSYGMLSVEGMAMGKAVVAFVRDDVKEKFPSDLPIVIANPDNLDQVLTDLLRDRDRLKEIGKASRKYVEKYHASSVVADYLIEIYKSL
ncbi:hypothetical protein [Metabacillus sp. SLBN-84]